MQENQAKHWVRSKDSFVSGIATACQVLFQSLLRITDVHLLEAVAQQEVDGVGRA